MVVMIDGVRYVPETQRPTNRLLLEALEVRFDSDAGDDITIRDYLHALLEALWSQGEGFSGKRPFGNSGWEYELYRPLIKHGFILGELDEDGYVNSITDRAAADTFVFDMIAAIFYGVQDADS